MHLCPQSSCGSDGRVVVQWSEGSQVGPQILQLTCWSNWTSNCSWCYAIGVSVVNAPDEQMKPYKVVAGIILWMGEHNNWCKSTFEWSTVREVQYNIYEIYKYRACDSHWSVIIYCLNFPLTSPPGPRFCLYLAFSWSSFSVWALSGVFSWITELKALFISLLLIKSDHNILSFSTPGLFKIPLNTLFFFPFYIWMCDICVAH